MKLQKKEGKRPRAFSRVRWGSLIPVLFTAAIGTLLLAVPEESAGAACIAVGCLLALSGVLLLAAAFGGRRRNFVRLVAGVIEIALSVWLFVDADGALSVLVLAFALILLIRGLLGMWGSLSDRRTGGSWWTVRLGGSLFVAVFAVIMLFRPSENVRILMLLIGAVMIFDALLECAALLRKLLTRRGSDFETAWEEQGGRPRKKGTEAAEELAAAENPSRRKRRFFSEKD